MFTVNPIRHKPNVETTEAEASEAVKTNTKEDAKKRLCATKECCARLTVLLSNLLYCGQLNHRPELYLSRSPAWLEALSY